MEVTPDLHGVIVTCQATNGIGSQIHDALALEVLCKSSQPFGIFLSFHLVFQLNQLIVILIIEWTDKPQFTQPADYTVDVVEGEPAIVNMTARANPTEITYKWFRDGTAVKASKDATAYDRLTFDGALLNLTVVRRDDKGDYKCEATNAEGSRATVVRLNVQCITKSRLEIIPVESFNNNDIFFCSSMLRHRSGFDRSS